MRDKSVRCDADGLEVAEVEMLRFSLRVTSMDRIRDEYIGGKKINFTPHSI